MKISVIISTYNRYEKLSIALRSLCQQETDGSFDHEIIVVDNNSKDLTKEIVDGFSKNSRQIRYVFESKQGVSNGMNAGIKNAKGEIIAFTDDDVIVDPKWLINIIQCFETSQCDGLGGRVLPVYDLETPLWVRENPTKLAGAVIICDYGPETKKMDALMDPFIGANFAFKRVIFDECGLFSNEFGSISLGEDTDFVERLILKKKNLYYCGQALVKHPIDPKRLSLKNMALWHIALGRFDAQREMKTGKNFVYYYGVPRYLIKGLFSDFLRIPMACLNRMSFINLGRSFFRQIGMIQGYRMLNHKQ